MKIMDELLRNWQLAVYPTLVYCGVGAWGTRRLAATLNYLCGAIRSRSDMAVLRAAINLNMALAAGLIVFAGLYTLVLSFHLFAGRFSAPTFLAYAAFLPLSGVLCSRLYFGPVEERARSLTVFSRDPEIEETYRRWLRQWREPRLQLPRD